MSPIDLAAQKSVSTEKANHFVDQARRRHCLVHKKSVLGELRRSAARWRVRTGARRAHGGEGRTAWSHAWQRAQAQEEKPHC